MQIEESKTSGASDNQIQVQVGLSNGQGNQKTEDDAVVQSKGQEVVSAQEQEMKLI